MNNSMENSTFLKQCPHLPKISIITRFPTKEYLVNFLCCFVVNIVITFCSIFLNLSTVLAYWKSSQLNKKISYFLIMIISLNDLAVGGIGSTSFLALFAKTLMKQGSCLEYQSVMISLAIFSSISLFTLLVLNLERYLSIVHPFFHRKHVTKRRLLALIGVLWMAVSTRLLFTTFVFERNNTTANVSGVEVAIVLVFVVYFNIMIFVTSRKRAVRNIFGSSATNGEKQFIMKLRLAKLCVIVFGGTLVCYFPLVVFHLIAVDTYENSLFLEWSTTFALFSSSLNSIIFFWRNPILRREAKKVLCNC